MTDIAKRAGKQVSKEVRLRDRIKNGASDAPPAIHVVDY